MQVNRYLSDVHHSDVCSFFEGGCTMINRVSFLFLSFFFLMSGALYAQEFTVDSHTVALWHCNEDSGTVLHDASPYHNDGVINNAAWVPGMYGSGLHFDGQTSYVEVPLSTSLKPAKEFSLEMTFRLDTLQFGSGLPVFLGCIGPYPSGGGYQLSMETTSLVFDYRVGNPVSEVSRFIPIPSAHIFYSVCATYQHTLIGNDSVTIMKVYINNILADYSVFPDEIQYNNTVAFWMGTNIDGMPIHGLAKREFPGTLDEIRISDIVRTPPGAISTIPSLSANITCTDPGDKSVRLQYGFWSGATNGLDSLYGESELPPAPPAGNFDARWLVSNSNGTTVNYHDVLNIERTASTFIGTVQPGAAGYPIVLNWNPAELTGGSFFLRDQETHGSEYSIDMSQQHFFEITDSTSGPFEIVADTRATFTATVNNGWNMLSLPAIFPDRSAKSVFPGSDSRAFSFQPEAGYVTVDTLEYGSGYWIKYSTNQTISLHGYALTNDTVALHAGWNMIGSISTPVSLAGIQTIPPFVHLSPFYTYTNAYFIVSVLEPMHSYWVKASEDCLLILTSGTGGIVK